MVIQRLQTLYLLMAIAVMVIFLFVPFGYWDVEVQKSPVQLDKLEAAGNAALLVPTVLSIVFMFIAILCFKKLPLQKSMVALSALMVVAIMLVVVYFMTRGFVEMNPQVTVKPEWGGGGLLLVGALLCLFMAYRGIRADQKLLRSYDRLR